LSLVALGGGVGSLVIPSIAEASWDDYRASAARPLARVRPTLTLAAGPNGALALAAEF
jgi:hypothetical protein